MNAIGKAGYIDNIVTSGGIVAFEFFKSWQYDLNFKSELLVDLHKFSSGKIQ